MEDLDLLTPVEVANIIGVTPDTARKRMMEMVAKKVPGVQPFGASYAIARTTLNEVMAQDLDKQPHMKLANGWPALTSREALKMLSEAGHDIAHGTMLDWLRKGVIPGRKIGKAWAVSRATLERLIAEGFEVPTRGRPPKGEGDAG